jgi:ferredoxin--NADP+ reductase
MESGLRVAVVGAGPSGVYAADALTFDSGADVPLATVDVIERLPVPFGLLRYGVAPDHLNIKSAGSTLQEVLDRPGVRFFGNVDIGTDVTVEDLRENYDAIVYATGASGDKTLDIPGDTLTGSTSATQFVNWYNGHPDQPNFELLHASSVAVVGVGNVAIDVARILLKNPDELAHTDMPEPVLRALRASKVTDVHVLGRRGAEHVKFTTKELRELGALDGIDVRVDARDLPGQDPEGASSVVRRNLSVLREWAARTAAPAPKRLHVHFAAAPVAVLGGDQVMGLSVQRRALDGVDSSHLPVGTTWDLACELLIRSVGYRTLPVPELPFDDRSGVIPNVDGRLVRDGDAQPGEYVTGWAKRGATGILGTNRADAIEMAEQLHHDRDSLLAHRRTPKTGIGGLLEARGVRYIDLDSWRRIAGAEADLGATLGRATVKITGRNELLSAAGLSIRTSSA